MDTEIVVVPVVFGVLAMVVKWWLEYRLKSKLIERGMVDERIKLLNTSALGDYKPSTLKWGIIFTLVGGALLIVQMLPVYIDGEVIFGLLLLSAGIGLLAFYTIDGIMRKNNPLQNSSTEESQTEENTTG